MGQRTTAARTPSVDRVVCAGGHQLAEHLPARAVRHPIVEPVEQPPAFASKRAARAVIRAGDEPRTMSRRCSCAPGDPGPSVATMPWPQRYPDALLDKLTASPPGCPCRFALWAATGLDRDVVRAGCDDRRIRRINAGR